MNIGRVSIVGAGPGQPDLLSIRGHRLLQEADAILYDALLAEAGFKEMFGASAETYFVGKRSSAHFLSQTEINELMVSLALKGQHVVRLKGGDPCVFGRGGEEALHLSRAGIPFEFVPGISSVNGVAARVQIPLTHRQLAGQFLVLEGHDLEAPFIDWPLLARFDGTLVWLMASRKAVTIAQRLLSHGAAPNLPIALVESDDFSHPSRRTATLRQAAEGALRKASPGPGIIYIGKTITVLSSASSDSLA